MKAIVRFKSVPFLESCEFCISQEGKHYCLLHSIQVKNMDTKRCKDFQHKADVYPDYISESNAPGERRVSRPLDPIVGTDGGDA